MTERSVKLTVQFSGGLELLFEKVKSQTIELSIKNSQPNTTVTSPDGQSINQSDETSTKQPITIRTLLNYLVNHKLKDRPELFLDQSVNNQSSDKSVTVRPGILVLVNDCDWELCGGADCELNDRDVVTFISTLHGG